MNNGFSDMMRVSCLISLVAKAPYPPFAELRTSKYSVTNIGVSFMEFDEEEEEKEEDVEREGEEEGEEEEEEEDDDDEGVRMGGVVIVWR
jgi:hypothetical protein